jgi:hypothetical protein
MKKNIIEHLFDGAKAILNRTTDSDRKIPGFETIIIPVDRKQFADYILLNKNSRMKK